jgi:4-oxalocrotonate tautomerase
MPIVTIQMPRGTSPGRQSASAQEKTTPRAHLLDVLNKPSETTYVVIEEVELENRGWGGMPTAQYRRLRYEVAGRQP